MQKQFPIPKLKTKTAVNKYSEQRIQNSELRTALIIFIKNPQLGKVKTRLAATIGNEKALEVYHFLLNHTKKITENLDAEKYLYYSDFVNKSDDWNNEIYHKKTQNTNPDLGEKMAFAFKDMIDIGYKKVLIIGSDCIEMTEELLNESYSELIDNEVVIGGANDGGYYLIGFDFEKLGSRCGRVLKKLFLGKEWSHHDVFKEAIEGCEKLNLKYALMPNLNDVDEEKDLKFISELGISVALKR